MERVNQNILKSFPIFKDLDADELQQLQQCMEYHAVPRNTRIYEQGQEADRLFFLVKGTIKIGTRANDDREIIKQILHPLAVFGEAGLLGEDKRFDFAQSMNDEVRVYAITVQRLRSIMLRNQKLTISFMNWIGRKLKRTEARLESMVFKDARERIIEFLRESARRRGKRVGYEMLIKHCLTQQDIANFTGTSRQTVTSVLNELRKSNLIHFTRRSILIRDLGKLV